MNTPYVRYSNPYSAPPSNQYYIESEFSVILRAQ